MAEISPTRPATLTLGVHEPVPVGALVRWFEDLGAGDVSSVGGKAASLGEMYCALAERGVRIPNGFATTVEAWDTFLDAPVEIVAVTAPPVMAASLPTRMPSSLPASAHGAASTPHVSALATSV